MLEFFRPSPSFVVGVTRSKSIHESMVGEVSGGQKCYTKPGSWDVSSFRSSVDIVPVNLETSKSVEQSTNAGAWKRAKEIKIAKHPVYQAAKELVLGSIQHVLG